MSNLISQVNDLCVRQLHDWQLVRDNYAALNAMLTRELTLVDSDGNPCARVILQHNPARVRSTAAKLTPDAIAARPCFLCDANQPSEQEAVLWKSTKGRLFKIQVNPYPIFKRHLTISLVEHLPQVCYYQDMIEIARQLPEHVIMFNGDGCGASAPDHMHFQATLQSELPLCAELEAREDNGSDNGSDNGYASRNEFWFDGSSGRQLVYARVVAPNSILIGELHSALGSWRCNALCWHKEGVWHLVYFPRTAGRSTCYGEGPGKFLLSPAAVEYGGVWVLPRKDDFDNLTAELISSIYQELSCTGDDLMSIYHTVM